ncbi:hypothetical protein D3C87_1365930 [compost metagenome]
MIFHRQRRIGPGQLQVQAQHFPRGRTFDGRSAELAPQSGQYPEQVLLFGGTLRGLLGMAGQVQRQLILAAALQHANQAQPRARPGALAVNAQGRGEIGGAFAILPHLE